MAMSLDEARDAFTRSCNARTFDGGIHAVTFQPTPNRANEDRYVVEEWNDVGLGSPWLFLAVLDGHAGSEAVIYTEKHLPTFLHNALRSKLAGAGAQYAAADISSFLRSQIEAFDYEIGAAVTALCPDPRELDPRYIQPLLNGPNSHIFRRASSGTTLSAALIDWKKENLWAIGLGDSSAVLLSDEGGSALAGKRLTPLHNTSTPSEYARVKLSHPTSEHNILKDQRVLGVLSVTRGVELKLIKTKTRSYHYIALGDFSFKLPAAYSANIFSKLRSEHGDFPVHDVSNANISPPYITSTSDVYHINLASIREKKPTLVLYTDGVNNIIEGRFLFRKDDPSRADPATVLGALLHEPVDEASLESVFEHKVESRWNGDGNRAVEILGNMLGGRDVIRMNEILTPELLSTTGDSDLYIDDTTIIVCPLK
ncbi:hypothetical protein DXG01_017198 [Tephrocybe rancida]|nr:hypothetical protein DXG01_017198 [Tephrocybe rancida]